MMVLEVANLKKTYLRKLPLYKQILLPFSKRQKVKALDSVSLCIETGQILGVVGFNSAGKTTLLRILADILEANGGTVSICGKMLDKNSFRICSQIGYMCQVMKEVFSGGLQAEKISNFSQDCTAFLAARLEEGLLSL
jgi:ABC-type multidrug transport system ATPase subunit